MKFSFISLTASSNNLATAKMLQLAIRVNDDEECHAEFDSFIKPIPRLTMAERATSPLDYSQIGKASPFCDLVLEIIPLIENSQTIFADKFSERLFIKSFKEIGYPVGRASYILQLLFKNTLGAKVPFSISGAMEALAMEHSLSTLLDHCRAMERIFSFLIEINSRTINTPEILLQKTNTKAIDFGHLPSTPGVYFFRNGEGEVIYVGKAINIQKRVRSHFNASELFERELCAQTASIDFEETGSETLALLLESHYITTLKPHCNTSQKEVLDPYIITSKLDGKGILRIQLIQKSYVDSENEFYYNRESVLKKMVAMQQKFNLCKRYTGIERTASKCSDSVFCKGICEEREDKNEYNSRVREALQYIYNDRPSYIAKLKGRNKFETAFISVKHGIYRGFGFIDNDVQINSIADIEGYIKNYSHNYFTSRIIDQFHKSNKNAEGNIILMDQG